MGVFDNKQELPEVRYVSEVSSPKRGKSKLNASRLQTGDPSVVHDWRRKGFNPS